jgi:hypothetical protein
MSSPRKVALLWRELEDAGLPSAEKLRFKEAGTVGALPVLIGVDGLGHRHICVPAPDADRGKHDTHSRGVSIEVRELMAGKNRRQFVDVRCSLPGLNALFSIVADEMLGQLERDSAHPFNACHEVLERWRELLERQRGALLGREQLAALMAELLVLERLVQRHGRAIEGWVGPEKSVHDFICGNVDVEVKSSLRTAGRVIEVHDLAQLEAPAGGKLFLNFTKLRFAPGRGRSVPEIVDHIAETCSDKPQLFERLALAGYDPVDRTAYEQSTFEVVEDLWYLIDEGFPRLTRRSFVPDQPPPAVTKISYTLDLDACPVPPLDPSAGSPITVAAEVFSK